jgi:probable addiction module antidote protein
VAYLEACMDEAGDDPAFIAQALGTIARARGMSRPARKTGLTREGLYKALSKDSNPSFGTVLKVMRAGAEVQYASENPRPSSLAGT